MLAAEAASALKLKNGNDYGVVLDGSLLEDIVTGIGPGVMNGNSPNVGTSKNNDKYDIHCHHLAIWQVHCSVCKHLN